MADEFDEFINAQEAKSTKYGTTMGINVVNRFFKSIGESRVVENIPPMELNLLLCRFFRDVKKLDGDNYEPGSLTTIHQNIQRYLHSKYYPRADKQLNIIHADEFKKSREVLASKRKELTNLGYGNLPNSTRELSEKEVSVLFDDGYFSETNAQSLVNAMWWFVSLHFGFRARHEARKLCWGDIILTSDENNVEILEWNRERGTKTRTGKMNETKRSYFPTVYATNNERCPIRFYKAFRDRRPPQMCTDDSPFFLLVNQKASATSWYKDKPMGHNNIGDILTKARKKYGFSGKKVSNHSVRKTGIGRLLDNNIPENYVAQQVGMKSTDSLKHYKTPNDTHRRQMSNVLSGKESDGSVNVNTVVKHSSPNTVNLSQEQSTSSSSKTMTRSLNIEGCSGCTFNFGVDLDFEPMAPKRKKVNLIEDSDDE